MDSNTTINTQIAVVGLGAAGAATLWALARAGCDAVGIEQFAVAHDLGSSHGQTRLLRVAYAEGERYVPLVRRAIVLWRELQDNAGESLFHETGVFYAGDKRSEIIASSIESARSHGVHLEFVAGEGLRNGLAVPDHWTAFVEAEGGFVLAERAITAFAGQARRAGARVLENTKVEAVAKTAAGIEIRTRAGTVLAKKAVVTAGSWAGDLLPSVAPAVGIERRVLHWFADKDGAYSLAAGFRPFILETDDGLQFYGFPAMDASGVKVAEHARGSLVACADALDRRVSASDIEHIGALVRRHIPALGGPVDSKVCMYPMSKDGHFIVDRLPSSERVIVGAGLSGHGFKFAPALGEALAALALDRAPPVDVGFLSLARFG